MSDLYTEHLVQKKHTAGDSMMKGLIIGLIVLAAFITIFVTPLGILILGGLILLQYAKQFGSPVEYEYLYVNGQLDIDIIMNRTRRKKKASYEMSDLEIIAPVKSHELDSYRNNKDIKRFDYSSGEENANIYAMVLCKNNIREFVIFEPNEVILNDIKRIAPRKVKLG